MGARPSSGPEPSSPAGSVRFDDELVGQTVGDGKYRILRLIGRGGMGSVFEAEHATMGRRFAIKVIDGRLGSDPRVTSRFEHEARAASAIRSEHIVTVFDFGTDAGQPYLVMELLRGEDLGSRLARLHTLPVPEALHITAQVLRGLYRAHLAGIVHRDLKPDNVILVEQEDDPLFAKIVDFGVSKMAPLPGRAALATTQTGVVLGTPLFMSPEQAEARVDIDARSDLYSVGAMLFECLVGRPPHVGESNDEILTRIRTEDAPRLATLARNVPFAIAAFVDRALRRDRDARFPSALSMLAALREIAPDEPAAYPPKAPLAGELELAKDLIAEPPPSLSPRSAPTPPSLRTQQRAPGTRRIVLTAFAATLIGVVLTVLVNTCLSWPAPQ